MNFYCSQKFENLLVNFERQEINSCCSAISVKVDTNWLKSNPTGLFNHPSIIKDRVNMVENLLVSSCNVCYTAENENGHSRRQSKNGFKKTNNNTNCVPKELTLSLNTACNLTCSYCCKEYSSSWLRDIQKNGVYFDNDARFTITTNDKLVLKAGHKIIKNSKNYKMLLDSALQYSNCENINITGGEPFLNNNLVDLLKQLTGNVVIYSGLGVNSKRLTNILNQLDTKQFSIVISAENINDFYEFNRYGNSFKNFIKNIEILESYNISYSFNSVISNLTIFGFYDFIKYFYNKSIFVSVCNDPDYLNPKVLDEKSKRLIYNTDYGVYTNTIHNLIKPESNYNIKKNTNSFLLEFAKRRSLNLEIFPNHFIDWLQKT
jgi:organic radical activating enzyme